MSIATTNHSRGQQQQHEEEEVEVEVEEEMQQLEPEQHNVRQDMRSERSADDVNSLKLASNFIRSNFFN